MTEAMGGKGADLSFGLAACGERSGTLAVTTATVRPAGGAVGPIPGWAVILGMYEHRGNGEHPQSLERRRQLLVWRGLLSLIAFGEVVGLVRLARGLFAGEPSRVLLYQVIVLVLNGLFGLLALARIRSLRRR
jgi:hypothetical protein